MIGFLAGLDRSLFLTLNSLHSAWLNGAMEFLSGQGIWVPVIVLAFAIARREYQPRDFWIFSLFLLLALVASDVTSSYLLKNVFNRLRPCREAELLAQMYRFGQKCGGKFGFVSSHAANSVVLVLYSLRSLDLRKPRWQLLWVLPILVGYSRIYLGVHYPGDILGGAAVGITWGLFFSWAFRQTKAQV